MAYTRVTNTRDGASAIRYAFEEESHKKGIDRVLASSGNNLDPNFAMLQMKSTWENYNKADGKTVQMYRIIQSFGLNELDPNNPEDIERANDIGRELAVEMYPDRQVLIVTQADGDGGKLHNHILVNSVSFIDGRSLRGDAKDWKTISAKSDEIIKRYGMEPLKSKKAWDKRTIAERKLSDQGEYVWKDDLKARIEEGLESSTVTSQDAFIERMRDDYEVDVNYRGKGMSYAFVDTDGKNRRIRSSRMGEMYEKENIEGAFVRNERIKQVESQSKSVIDVEINDKGVDATDNAFTFDVGAELSAILDGQKPKNKNERTDGDMGIMDARSWLGLEVPNGSMSEEEKKKEERKRESDREYRKALAKVRADRVAREKAEYDEKFPPMSQAESDKIKAENEEEMRLMYEAEERAKLKKREEKEMAKQQKIMEKEENKQQKIMDKEESKQEKQLEKEVAGSKTPSLLHTYQEVSIETSGESAYSSPKGEKFKMPMTGLNVYNIAESMEKESEQKDTAVGVSNDVAEQGLDVDFGPEM